MADQYFNSSFLRKLRYEWELTQEKLAAMAKVDVTTIRNYESGRVNSPCFEIRNSKTYSFLQELVEIFELTGIEDLFATEAPAPRDPCQAPHEETPPISPACAIEDQPPGAVRTTPGDHSCDNPEVVPESVTEAAAVAAVLSDPPPSVRSIVLLFLPTVPSDLNLAEGLIRQLEAGGVQVSRGLNPGEVGAQSRALGRRLRAADIVVALVSEASASSELLAEQVLLAGDASLEPGGPRLMALRNQLTGVFAGALAVLRSQPTLSWRMASDTERVAKRILDWLEKPGATPVELPPAAVLRGALPLDSQFYIEREADFELLNAIERNDGVLLIQGPRQIGKTSLLSRGLQRLRTLGARVAFTDLQGLNACLLSSPDAFMRALASALSDALGLDIDPGAEWRPSRGPNQNFRYFLQRQVLERVPGRIVWGLDELDRLFICPFGADVFGFLRACYNDRAAEPEQGWERLTFVLGYATEPYLFITDLCQSPFNVGTRLPIRDFCLEEVSALNDRYGRPIRSHDALVRFHTLVGGQPYLVQRGLRELASGEISVAGLEALVAAESGPFADHLRRLELAIARDPTLLEMLRAFVTTGRRLPRQAFLRLRTAGVIQGDSSEEARLRCPLYYHAVTGKPT